jgi:outer membrane protein insertion porin family
MRLALLVALALTPATVWAEAQPRPADKPGDKAGDEAAEDAPADATIGPPPAVREPAVPPMLREGATAPSTPSFDPGFGPRYHIEDVVVRGNRKTQTALILREIELHPGDEVSASDDRVEAARFRLLSLGYFLDARLSLVRGSKRGGAVLLVEVEERGTIVINELYPSTSAATAFWGGADASETNFLGRGINLGAGFVASTRPNVPDAVAGLGLRLHGSSPELPGLFGLSLAATGLYNDASEFYRASGADSDPDPAKFVAVRTRRVGGMLGAGRSLGHQVRVFADFREEAVSATFPGTRVRLLDDGLTTQPIDFEVRQGGSRVGSLTLTIDYDTRSDPVLPRSGGRLVASLEGAHAILGSSYDFVKGQVQASVYQRMPHGHALGFHLFAGGITGDAPYFDRFFVGDLNLLLPRRALGINFSTLPSRNVLGTAIAGHRYDDFAGRLLVEYAIPIWRRHGFVYGGDAFAAFGLFALAESDDFHGPDRFDWSHLPIDLTGDIGLRLDTYVGVFTVSIANALSRSSF